MSWRGVFSERGAWTRWVLTWRPVARPRFAFRASLLWAGVFVFAPDVVGVCWPPSRFVTGVVGRVCAVFVAGVC
jgi:hypothetical protein